MPRAPRKPCTVYRCPNRTERGGRCDAHRREADRATKAAQPWRDYGADWQAARLEQLEAYPVCRCDGCPRCLGSPCARASAEVDHVRTLRDGGTHEQANLRAKCKPCHSHRTATDNGLGGPVLA